MKKYTQKFLKLFTHTQKFDVNLLGKRGFTLVESLVAIAILSLSVAATFTAVQSGLKASLVAKDEITAFYLAQEAMEYIKNIRDENALRTISGVATNWLTGFTVTAVGGSGPCDFGKVCYVDSVQDTITNCPSGVGTCPRLNQDSVTNLYSYSSGSTWVVTNFKREIQFQAVPSNSNEVLVIINMSWISGGVAKSFQVSQSLFNRQ